MALIKKNGESRNFQKERPCSGQQTLYPSQRRTQHLDKNKQVFSLRLPQSLWGRINISEMNGLPFLTHLWSHQIPVTRPTSLPTRGGCRRGGCSLCYLDTSSGLVIATIITY